MFTDDQLLPLSALQHWLYCPRQCALIHLEQAWAENKFTADGRVMHENAHEGTDETKAGVRITRGMPVRSMVLGISGQCDVVEFRAAGDGDLKFEISDLRGRDDASATERTEGNFKSQISDLKCTQSVPTDCYLKSQISNLNCTAQAVPVEYKRGKPKAHRADEVQLCAQAMCLEEMLGIRIDSGALYYGEKRRRTEVRFDEDLRALVAATAAAFHVMINSRRTPQAEYEPRKCDACSLIDFCQPLSMRFKKGAAAWFSANLKL